MERMARVLWYGLWLVHAGLAVWAVLGMAEFLMPVRLGLANALFPDWMQLLHWSAIGLGAAAFLLTWARRPQVRFRAVALAYALMALVCLVQTLLFLQHPGKWLAMALEYATYLGILWLLAHLPPPPRPRRLLPPD